MRISTAKREKLWERGQKSWRWDSSSLVLLFPATCLLLLSVDHSKIPPKYFRIAQHPNQKVHFQFLVGILKKPLQWTLAPCSETWLHKNHRSRQLWPAWELSCLYPATPVSEYANPEDRDRGSDAAKLTLSVCKCSLFSCCESCEIFISLQMLKCIHKLKTSILQMKLIYKGECFTSEMNR